MRPRRSPRREAVLLAALALISCAALAATNGLPPLAPAGDAARGRALLVARDNANCVLCHAIPDPALPFAGDVGPSLAGVGTRLGPAEIRLRIVDNARVNPRTIMPSYFRADGLDRVAAAYRGRTILSAQDVEDLVAYLAEQK